MPIKSKQGMILILSFDMFESLIPSASTAKTLLKASFTLRASRSETGITQ